MSIYNDMASDAGYKYGTQENVQMGRDFTLFAVSDGKIQFSGRKVNVV